MLFRLSIALLFITNGLFAQTNFVPEPFPIIKTSSKISTRNINNKAVTDTLGPFLKDSTWLPIFAPNDSVVCYAYPGGGWLYGNNVSVNNLTAVAQGYKNVDATAIGLSEVLIWFCGKSYTSLDTNSKLSINIYDIGNNIAGNTNGSGGLINNSKGPNNILLTKQLKLVNADTNFQTFTSIPLDTILEIFGDFAIGVDFSIIKAFGDTVGILSDKKNDAHNLDYAFHYVGALNQWVVSDWLFSPSGNGELDNNMAIFGVIDAHLVGVNDIDYFNDMQLSAYPIPSHHTVTLQFDIKEQIDVAKIEIYNSLGQIVFNQIIENPLKENLIQINTNAWGSGIFYYSLITKNGRLTKKLIVN